MSTASVISDDLQTGVVDPPSQEQQQAQIAAVTNGGVSIVPNSINDGPLVHMGISILLVYILSMLIKWSAQDARRLPYRGQILVL